MSATGRPPLPLYRADLSFAVDLHAADEAEAAQRLEELARLLRPYLAKAVRARRIGGCHLIPDTIQTHDPSEV